MDEEKVSQYLLSNPDFLKKWLQKHGTADMVDSVKIKTPEKSVVRSESPKTRSMDSQRNSITSNMFRRYVEGNISKIKRASTIDSTSLQHLNQTELFMELIRDIATELDVNVLCHKILQNVGILTKSDRGSLFLVRGSVHHKYLVSKLFDVTRTSTLEESIHTEEKEIKVPFGRGIAGHVAETKETVNIKEAYEDPRFNQDVDKKTGYRTHCILCMPILSYDGEVIGVAQIINKVAGQHEFTKQDEEHFRRYLIFCGIGITNAQLFEMSVQEFKRNQLLLKLARGVFEEQSSLEKLIQKIMLQAQELLKCERCSAYLIEDVTDGADPFTSDEKKEDYKNPTSIKEVIFSKAFNLNVTAGGSISVPSAAELAESKHAEIAKHVVVSGMPLNISDAEIEDRFGKGAVIDDSGFITQSILCMPIYNSEKKIIGVTQLINKLNKQPFNDNDANIIEAFSIFTGLGIHNCQMYENACRLMAKQSVALEVLSYHATAQKDETEKLMKLPLPSAKEWMLYSFEFNDIPMEEIDTLRAVISMFNESEMINKFRIPYDVMCRWTCSVKKNYRPVTYHNWRHAFNVTQTMFTMLYTGNLRPKFTDIDVLALLVGCLCHDLDHRGTNNAFQVKTVSPLAMLYSTSVMEHHHFDHCIMILNSEGNNILQSLSPDEYRQVIKKLEHAILSTDLALYFKKRGDFKSLIDAGEIEFKDSNQKDLLGAMMMTACDVAAICKPWEIQKEVAQLVANEFFEQGDIEKTQLGEKPIAMMDREKKDELPKMQVGFIDAICIPVYKMFAEMNVKLDPLYKGVLNNRENWQQMADERERKMKAMEKVSDHGSSAPVTSSVTKSGNQNGVVCKQSKDAENMQAKGKASSLRSQQQQSGTPKRVTAKEPGKTKICLLM